MSRSIIWVGGNRAELYSAGILERAKLQLLVVPGNPGAAQFYAEYLQQVVKACAVPCYAEALSHLGHAQGVSTPAQLFSLQDQVQHHLSYIRDYVLPRRVPAIVLGHSIGAFIAVEACHRLSQATGRPASDLGVRQVWAVFPFLSVNKDCRRQTAIRRLTQLPLLLAAGAALLALLPSAVKHFIAARYTGKLFTANAQAACVRLVGFTTAHNALYMGKREFRELTLGVAWAPLQALGSRLLVAFAGAGDIWFNAAQLDDVCKHCPQAQVVRLPQQKHDFVTQQDLSEAMAAQTADWLEASTQTSDVTA